MNKHIVSHKNDGVKSQTIKLELNRWQTVEDIAKILNGILKDNVVLGFEAERKSSLKSTLTIEVKEQEVKEKAVVMAKGKGVGKSQYRGVFWDKHTGKWRVLIQHEGKRKHVGRFTNEVEAAIAYDRASYQICGLEGWFNFPETIKFIHDNKVDV